MDAFALRTVSTGVISDNQVKVVSNPKINLLTNKSLSFTLASKNEVFLKSTINKTSE